MYSAYADQIYQDDLLYEQPQRSSDIQLPPIMNGLLLVVWAAICAIGFAVIFMMDSPVAGAVIIAVPTFIGMVIKPTFALCALMLVLPTGAGVGYEALFSLDRGVGIALAVSFLLNVILSRPHLRIRNRALWIAGLYTLWVFMVSLASPYTGFELRRAFTQFQLLALFLIVYWILETNGRQTFVWALRSYLIGSLGTTFLTYITGAAVRSIQEEGQARYAATLGRAIDANMLAALTAMAFLVAVYLFARDKNVLWRILYLVGIVFLPVMLLRIGSRGAMIALGFTLLSPLLFVRQVLRRPGLALLLLVVIVLASISAGLLVKGGWLQESVVERLTDVGYAKQSISYRMHPIAQAVRTAFRKPAGTGYYSWFEQSGSPIWPHNDFFLALGVYGMPGAAFFALMMLTIMLTVKRAPIGIEKLFVRAALVFLLVMGLTIGQLSHKYLWAFLAFVIAGERVARLYVPEPPSEPAEQDMDAALMEYELSR